MNWIDWLNEFIPECDQWSRDMIADEFIKLEKSRIPLAALEAYAEMATIAGDSDWTSGYRMALMDLLTHFQQAAGQEES